MISAMLQYIQRSPDCFHAVEELRQRLLLSCQIMRYYEIVMQREMQ